MKYLIVLILFFSATVNAAYKVEGAVIDKMALNNENGIAFVRLEGGEVTSTKNSCATTSWSIAHKIESNEISRAQFSMLLAAKASGAKVNISGSGDCGIGYGVETLITIVLED